MVENAELDILKKKALYVASVMVSITAKMEGFSSQTVPGTDDFRWLKPATGVNIVEKRNRGNQLYSTVEISGICKVPLEVGDLLFDAWFEIELRGLGTHTELIRVYGILTENSTFVPSEKCRIYWFKRK